MRKTTLSGKQVEDPKTKSCQILGAQGPVSCKCGSIDFLPVEFLLKDTEALHKLTGIFKCKKCGTELRVFTEDKMNMKLTLEWPDGKTTSYVL